MAKTPAELLSGKVPEGAMYYFRCPRCKIVHIFSKNTNPKCREALRKILNKNL